jgi:hypothetical protein
MKTDQKKNQTYIAITTQNEQLSRELSQKIIAKLIRNRLKNEMGSLLIFIHDLVEDLLFIAKNFAMYSRK